MRPLTVGDLCELAGYTRDQMRGLLAELPRFSQRRAEARVARVFSSHDALLVVVLARLETVYGLKRSAVTRLSESIATVLAAPRAVSKDARLLLHLELNTCEYAEGAALVADGLVVQLSLVFDTVDAYLLQPLAQREVGLSAVTTASDSRSARPSAAAKDAAARARTGNRRRRNG